MRRAGYRIATDMSGIMKEVLKLDGEDPSVFYRETAGKRDRGFNVIDETDVGERLFSTNLYFSPLATGLPGGSEVPARDFQAGAIEGMFNATGKKVRIVETRCLARGDDVCVFENRK
jgi:predicted hydrocarbon binding protein